MTTSHSNFSLPPIAVFDPLATPLTFAITKFSIMKKFPLQSFGLFAMIILVTNHFAFSQANTSLSNLTSPTSVNQSLLPSSDNTKDFGSTASSWKNGYFDGTGFFLNGLNVGGSSSTNGIQMNPNSTGKTLELRFMELTANGTNYVGFRGPTSVSTNQVWTLPSADGTSGQVLGTNGAGVLSWVTPSGGSSITNNFTPRSNGTGLIDGSLYDNGTKIGFGTSSPNGFFHISKNADADNPHLMIKETSTDGYARIYLASFSNMLGDDSKWKILGRTSLTDENNEFYIQQVKFIGGNNVGYTRFYISSNGRTGIGTSVPAANLHVNSTPNVGDKFIVGPETGTPLLVVKALGGLGVNVADPNSRVHINSDGGEDPLRVQVNGISKLYVNSNGGTSIGSSSTPPLNGLFVSGNTGMGTASPQVRLHLFGTDEVLRLDGTNPYMQFFSAGVAKSYIQSTGNDFNLGTVGTNTTGKVTITTGSSTAMTLKAGKVGIGTTSPSSLLHLKGNNEVMRIEGTNPYIQFYSGTVAKSFVFQTGNDLKIGTSTGNTSGKVIIATQGGGNQLILLSDGRVAIGTAVAKTGYQLSVEGKVVCRELKVETDTWPDYVFEKDYHLLSLSELESFIAQNNHLPDVPSATEMQADGISVGEMQTKLMQKIEELTLYMIDLQKQNDQLKSEVAALKN